MFDRDQSYAVSRYIQVDACKTGILANREIVELVAEAIRRNKLAPFVCDPVMFAKSGDKLLKEDAVEAVKKLLFPLATVVTPNRREAALLTGTDPESLTTVAAAKDAARRLLGLGAKSAVVKGI